MGERNVSVKIYAVRIFNVIWVCVNDGGDRGM